jgi:hypothetical protein
MTCCGMKAKQRALKQKEIKVAKFEIPTPITLDQLHLEGSGGGLNHDTFVGKNLSLCFLLFPSV